MAPPTPCRLAVAAWLALTAALTAAPAATADATPEHLDFFERKIRPVLVKHCYECHSDEFKKARGGLKLDTREATRKGGETGPGLVPGKPDQSPVVQAVRYHDELKMPPAGKLPEAVAQDFEAWVRDGAADPRTATKAPSGSTEIAKSTIDYAKGRQFWAFQPPKSYPAPAVHDEAWPKTGIDPFVLTKLEAAGLPPAGRADPRTLVRRLAFDLTGLPPAVEVVEAFAADPSPAAYAGLVDKLLASPAHGERWARVWLDVARYAEDQAHIVGADASLTYPNAYLYRDWVIAALNADVPYDRFVELQLAADLIEGADSPNLAALGFLGLGPKYYSRGSLAVMADEWEDRVDVVSRGLMGLTVACARCHDHKFDPVGTNDYYALAGVFAGTEMFNRPIPGKTEPPPDPKLPAPKKPRADPSLAMHVVREGTPTNLNVFVRGDVDNKGPVAPRRFLPVLTQSDPKPFASGSGRRELAEAVADPDNPLTARVIVNRVWAAYFGRGLVGTPSNFGQLGDRPTHPELLDDLAVRFVEAGWSLKWLHREIVSSATYQQSSRGDPRTVAADAENRLLGRMPRRRLSVEQWRDAVLAAAGVLDAATVGGSSIDPLDPKAARRTVYSKVSRLELNRLLAMFDFPDANVTADRRVETTTPLQKMFVMNSPFMAARAGELADRLRDAEDNDEGRIDFAYRLLYGRPPTAEETRLGLAYLGGGDRWTQYAHALLAANEMMFVD